jgi:hypothetical protein
MEKFYLLAIKIFLKKSVDREVKDVKKAGITGFFGRQAY